MRNHVVAAFIVGLLVIISTVCRGQSSREMTIPPKLVILIVPGLTAADIRSDKLSELRRLASESAVGWMNCRTARVPGQTREPEESAYLTLGAGSRGTAPPNTQFGLMPDCSAAAALL